MKPTPTNDERLEPSEIDIELQFQPSAHVAYAGAAGDFLQGDRRFWPVRLGQLWVDCEFNGWGGDLISLALVDDEGREFYEVLECADPQPWVRDNVIPVLGKAPVPLGQLQLRLHQWLSAYDRVHLVADWPDDVAYFCRALITGPGERLDTPAMTMEIRRDLDAASKIPHNALEDAKAIRARHLALITNSPPQIVKCTRAYASAARAGGQAAGEFEWMPPITQRRQAGQSIETSDAGRAGVVSDFVTLVAAATARPSEPGGAARYSVKECREGEHVAWELWRDLTRESYGWSGVLIDTYDREIDARHDCNQLNAGEESISWPVSDAQVDAIAGDESFQKGVA